MYLCKDAFLLFVIDIIIIYCSPNNPLYLLNLKMKPKIKVLLLIWTNTKRVIKPILNYP